MSMVIGMSYDTYKWLIAIEICYSVQYMVAGIPLIVGKLKLIFEILSFCVDFFFNASNEP